MIKEYIGMLLCSLEVFMQFCFENFENLYLPHFYS